MAGLRRRHIRDPGGSRCSTSRSNPPAERLLDGGGQRVGRLVFSLGTSVIEQLNRSEDATAIVSPSIHFDEGRDAGTDDA